jgi:hypothetical protein
MCWLNSDDWYLPGAFYAVAQEFRLQPFDFVYGGCLLRDDDCSSRNYKVQMPQLAHQLTTNEIAVYDFIEQPSSFWSRRSWEAARPLDDSLHYAFDWDFFIRISGSFPLRCTEAVLSAYRYHAAHKSSTGGDRRLDEIIEVVKRHAGEGWPEVFEECRNILLPAARQFVDRWKWLLSQPGGGRVFEAKRKAVLRPLIRRHGEHKVSIASQMLGITWR